MSEKNSRRDEIRQIHIESATAYHVLGGLALVCLGIWIGAHLFAADTGFGSNIYAEFIGIIAAYFIIDFLNRKSEERRREREYNDRLLREELRRERELKDRLLREARSPEPEIARFAFFDMQDRGLIYGEESILRDANLWGAKPVKADLEEARLDGARLGRSDFSRSSFLKTNLESVKLMEAHLDDASLVYANLKNADLQGAYLSRANLAGADLRGANLRHVHFENANFAMTGGSMEDINQPEKLSEFTILPDSNLWQTGTDLDRFTDPDHPEFWRSSDPQSPAHHDHPNSYFDFLASSI